MDHPKPLFDSSVTISKSSFIGLLPSIDQVASIYHQKAKEMPSVQEKLLSFAGK
jgi:hypothetical protein